MNTLDDNICEQLSAWMDGELSGQEAKFLERRLQHDETLQAMYSRLQMTSACMKGQSARLMPHSLCTNIKQALEAEFTPQKKSRKPLFAWAAAASMAFAAIVFIPNMMQSTNTAEAQFSINAQVLAPPDDVVTFASADLIANTPTRVNTSSTDNRQTSVPKVSNASNLPSIAATAALDSPENFPLNISSEKKTWPRATINANSDPALEAYLVRHNQMMAQDGMGGFVPYVDVVAQDAAQAGLTASTDETTIKKAGDTK